jgi:primosomal protein N' (replication factor Y)
MQPDARAGCRVRVPFGPRRLVGVIVETDAEPPDGVSLKDVLDVIDTDRPALTGELLNLTRWMANYYVCAWGEAAKAALPPAGENPKTAYHLRLTADGASADALKEQLRGHRQRAVIDALFSYLDEGEPTPLQTDVKARTEAPASTIASLVEKGMVERFEQEIKRSPFADVAPPDDPPQHSFYPAQERAFERIRKPISEERYRTFLLHGVTGSGKTAVYIAALRETLARGKSGIILVPEIALTPQTVRRFRRHFPDEVAVFHSQMNAGERYDAWRQLRAGERRIVIGPRSAVLAPLRDVGLIVVDEEHETSYKQFDPAPRYHARDVAVMRARQTGAACVLGSATPSLESTMNAHREKYTRLEMPERVPALKGELPEVQIVDLTKERKKRQLAGGVLSKPLRDGIRERLGRDEQTILLQNRRGYAPIVECADCGFSPTCGDCSVTLTFHKSGGRGLRCHYCGKKRRFPRECPSCGGSMERLGTGTQRVVEELEKAFPEASVTRMDRDATRRKDAHRRILNEFGSGEADVLVGTQMVAKGLDFHRVTLVGVVNADAGLLMPDFRATEHTFQLLTQVAGRAGRADLRGEVLLQTRNPKSPTLQHALSHDYKSFARHALRERRALRYPPFGRIAAVEFRGPGKKKAKRIGRQWTAEAERRTEQIDVIGPEPALVERVKRNYRFRTILKAARSVLPGRIQRLLRAATDAAGSVPNGYRLAIDVDAARLT